MSKRLFVLLILASAPHACARKDVQPAAEPPVKVETTTVEQRPVAQILMLAGTLRGVHESRLAAGAAGRVTEVVVDKGVAVRNGATVARLDVRAATLAAAAAEAGLASQTAQKISADAECERSRRLMEAHAITPQIYERSTAQCAASAAGVDAALAQASLARLTVSDGVVRAPFTAVVIDRFVHPGEYVMPGSPVVALADVDEMRLDLSVPEQNFTDVQLGADVRFSVPAYPRRVFAGSILRKGGAVRRESRDVLVEVSVPNADHALLPGMFATAEISLSSRPVSVIPASAILIRDEQSRVLVLQNGRLEERVIQTGAKIDDAVTVIRGVAAGELVVLNPSDRLRNGQAAH